MRIKSRTIFAVIMWCLTAAWLVFIFVMSAKNASESGAISGSLIRRFAEWFVADFKSMTAQQMHDYIEGLQGVVRSLGHLTEYGVLGCLTYSSLRLSLTGFWKPCLWAFGIGSVYAVSDEIHQLFVPGRAFQLTDIVIDSIGVILGICLVATVVWIIKRIKWPKLKKQVKSRN